MARTLTFVHPGAVCALMARLWLGEGTVKERHGSIVLRRHQHSALERIRRMLELYGGALLADDVGLGKTYVGAALATGYRRVLVVAPAALRAMWQKALRDVGAGGNVTSYAALSRGAGPRGRFDLVLADEAHHARTPGTRRYQRLAELADGAHVLLLSATPIHNSRRDIVALLALFLGTHASTLGDDELARYVIRREREDVPAVQLPETASPIRVALGNDEPLLDAILALPPPLAPRDAGTGGALVAWGLARAWASSNAALIAALRRRLVRASALDAALASGQLPSRRELASWIHGDDAAVQLFLPGLFDVPQSGGAELRAVVGAHERAVRSLLERAHTSAWTDVVRASSLSRIRAVNPGEKVVAFTQFADTARALFHELRREPRVAVLTGGGAAVAGGPLTRREAIERFAPRAAGVHDPKEAERIDFLIATDLLSEGVNLHDASVVVHLDLPWTAARMEQRVGRSRRMGALHARTRVYMLEPPASSEGLLRVEWRLREKFGTAVSFLGHEDVPILPGNSAECGGDRMHRDTAEDRSGRASAARVHELIAREVERWREYSGADRRAERPSGLVVGAVCAKRNASGGGDDMNGRAGSGRAGGLLALVAERGEYRLVAALENAEVSDDRLIVLEAVRRASSFMADTTQREIADDSSGLVSSLDAAAAVERVREWASSRSGAVAADPALAAHATVRRRALRRVASIAAHAPRHMRAEITRLAALARGAAVARYGAGREHALQELVANEDGSGEEWLRAMSEFGAAHPGPDRIASGEVALVEPVAILVFAPG